MKKIILVSVILGIIGISLTFCSKDENTPIEIKELRFDISVNDMSSGTKVVKTSWENGDKIFVFFSCKNTKHRQMNKFVTLTYNGSTWIAEASSGLNAYSDLYSYGKMHALFFPFGNVRNTTSALLMSSENAAINNSPALSYYLTDDADYTIGMTGGIATLSGNLNLKIPDNFVYFYIDEKDGKFNENEKYRLSVEGVRPVTITGWSTSGYFTQIILGSGQPMWGYKYGDGIAFSGMVDDSWSAPADHRFIFFEDGEPAVTKIFNKSLDVSDHKHPSIRLKAPTAINGWTQAISTPQYTLMGDGLKWARWNLGCTDLADESTGIAFRWGDLVPASGDYYCLLPLYQNIEGAYQLFDVARAYLGADWRMPSKTEFETLAGCCDLSSSSGGSVTGGDFTGWALKLTSNTGGNSNSIMLRTISGSAVGYWTSTYKNSSTYCAFYKRVSSGGDFGTFDDNASSAKIIRPIYIGPTP